MKSFFTLFSIFRVGVLVRGRRRVSGIRGGTRKEYVTHKEAARVLIKQRLLELNRHYGFTYHKVAIRDQRSRWGSCSKKGNLNFNYRLLHLPSHLADYIMVHELCHLAEFNHSKKFWDLVGETIADHRQKRKALRALAQLTFN